MSAAQPDSARSGPFAWSTLGGASPGYIVASYDENGPVIDVVLLDDDAPARTVALRADEASRLADQLRELAGIPGQQTSWMLPDVYRDVEALDGAVRTWDATRRSRAEQSGALEAPGAEEDAMAGLVALEQVDALIRRLFDVRDSLAADLARESVVVDQPASTEPSERKLTTMGGLLLAAGIAALFWLVIGLVVWILLR